MFKSGFKTSEFWISIATQAITLLVLAGVIAPGDRDTVQGAIVNGIAAAFTLIASVVVVVQYIKSRTMVKASDGAAIPLDGSPTIPEGLMLTRDADLDEARAAGVPWLTIIAWLVSNRGTIRELIDSFRRNK